jgi:hypothetical protein
MRKFLRHSLTLTLLYLQPSFILVKHRMTLNLGVDVPVHYYCLRLIAVITQEILNDERCLKSAV